MTQGSAKAYCKEEISISLTQFNKTDALYNIVLKLNTIFYIIYLFDDICSLHKCSSQWKCTISKGSSSMSICPLICMIRIHVCMYVSTFLLGGPLFYKYTNYNLPPTSLNLP